MIQYTPKYFHYTTIVRSERSKFSAVCLRRPPHYAVVRYGHRRSMAKYGVRYQSPPPPPQSSLCLSTTQGSSDGSSSQECICTLWAVRRFSKDISWSLECPCPGSSREVGSPHSNGTAASVSPISEFAGGATHCKLELQSCKVFLRYCR